MVSLNQLAPPARSTKTFLQTIFCILPRAPHESVVSIHTADICSFIKGKDK
jgi:hypothetical protein